MRCLATIGAGLLALCALVGAFPRIVDPSGDGAGALEFGEVRQIPDSPIQISTVQLPTKRWNTSAGNPCLTFVNTGSVVATHVLFAIQTTARDGQVVYRTTLDATGKFSPGIAIGNPVAPITNWAGGHTGMCSDERFAWLPYWTNFYADPLDAHGQRLLDDDGPEALVASVAEIDFADGTSWNSGPNVLADTIAAPGSGVRIVRAFAWQPATSPQECVAYTNGSARAIAATTFSFVHVAESGEVLSEETWDDRTPLAAGKNRPDLCVPFAGTVSPQLGEDPFATVARITTGNTSTHLVVRVTHVDYANGDPWDAPAATLAPTSGPVAVDIAHAYWWPPSATAHGTLTQLPDSKIDLTSAYVWIPGISLECVDLTNLSARPIERVYIRFRHTSLDGKPLGSERMPYDWTLAPGPSRKQACRDFDNASGFGNLLLPVSWLGGNMPTRDVYTTLGGRPQAYVAQLEASVDEVDYMDGTKWKAPVINRSARL